MCSRSWSRDSPATYAEDHDEVGRIPAVHRGPCQNTYPHCSLWRTLCWSRLLAGALATENSPRRTRFSGRTCDTVGAATLEQSFPDGLHLVERTNGGALFEEQRPVLEEFVRYCSPREGPMLEQGNSLRQEWQRQNVTNQP